VAFAIVGITEIIEMAENAKNILQELKVKRWRQKTNNRDEWAK
jgi:hypothetical protein